MRAKVTATIVGALLILSAIPGGAQAGRVHRARLGVRYLVKQQDVGGSIVGLFNPIADTADAVLAMIAARRAPGAIDEAIGYLRRSQEEIGDLGETAKVVMALAAAGRSPRTFAGRNLVKELKDAQETDGQYGNNPFSAVFDHALTVLALRSVGAPVPRPAMRWLAEAQCGDGGWAFDQPSAAGDDEHCFDASAPDPGDFTASDTNTSAYVVMAWNARPSTVPLATDPFDFFTSARDEHFGGWVYDPRFKCATPDESTFCYRTDASSTALVLQAHAAEQKPVPAGGFAALKALQVATCGPNAGAFAAGYEYAEGEVERTGPNTYATIQAIPGLLGKPFPLDPAGATSPPPSGEC